MTSVGEGRRAHGCGSHTARCILIEDNMGNSGGRRARRKGGDDEANTIASDEAGVERETGDWGDTAGMIALIVGVEEHGPRDGGRDRAEEA